MGDLYHIDADGL